MFEEAGGFGKRLFLYPPDVLAMHINGDDAPSLAVWTGGQTAGTVEKGTVEAAGERIHELLHAAGGHFLRLKAGLPSLAEFLAKFADLLVRESKGEIALDGRRLGFLYRNILANRSVELAKAGLMHTALPDFTASAKYVLESSVPAGLNEEGIKREEAAHKMDICFDLLSAYFNEDAEIAKVNQIYELFTTRDLMRRAELLLTAPLGEMALSKAWTDLMADDKQNLTLLAYTALQIEARRPGAIPQELLASLAAKVDPHKLSTKCISRIENEGIEYIHEVEHLLNQKSDLARLVAYHHVEALADTGRITPKTLDATAKAIQRDIRRFEAFVNNRVDGEEAAA